MAEILNDSMVLFTTLDDKEKKCNIHHVKPVSSPEVYVGLQVEVNIGTFPTFQDSIKQNTTSTGTGDYHYSYNLQSKTKNQ